MIFKHLEIYLLSASSKKRWGFIFILYSSISALWYLFAFEPLRTKVLLLNSKLIVSEDIKQESSKREILYDSHQKIITQRIYRVKNYNDLLSDIVKAHLTISSIVIDSVEKRDDYVKTKLHMTLEGSFNNFYNFLSKTCQKDYLIQWNSCTCTLVSSPYLSISANITIYSK